MIRLITYAGCLSGLALLFIAHPALLVLVGLLAAHAYAQFGTGQRAMEWPEG